jgi:hypothetical protein
MVCAGLTTALPARCRRIAFALASGATQQTLLLKRTKMGSDGAAGAIAFGSDLLLEDEPSLARKGLEQRIQHASFRHRNRGIGLPLRRGLASNVALSHKYSLLRRVHALA